MNLQGLWRAVRRRLRWVRIPANEAHEGSVDLVAAETRYRIVVHGKRSAALQQAKEDRVLALVGSTVNPKWALVKCPCGCDQILELNLMKTHYPRWRLRILRNGTFALSPSINALACGAHFWFVDGRVVWAKSYLAEKRDD
jgi:hypothetical protein